MSPEIDLVNPEAWTCPMPLRDHDRIVMGHGGGGKLSAELIEHLFLPAFGLADVEMHDAATLLAGGERLAFSTDSYVVQPLFFPGGCIGDLAVNGTINDVAMAGARPLALSAGFILEEGLKLETLGLIADAMGRAARVAGVQIATGDTKVVEAGHGDGVYVNTAGVGVIPEGVDIRPSRAAVGDAIIVSGPIGLHGVAVMSKREGLEFGTDIKTDCVPLNGLVAEMLVASLDIHVLRDATRGGVAAAMCEIASAADVGVTFEESLVPVPPEVAAACSFLGLDPLNIANEGRLIAFVPQSDLSAVMTAMQNHQHGVGAKVVGTVTDRHPGVVTAKTRLGSTRIVDVPLGEQLPRIC